MNDLHYTMVIKWSDEDNLFIVALPEFGPFCLTHGKTYKQAFKHGLEVLDLLVEDLRRRGEPLPVPSGVVEIGSPKPTRKRRAPAKPKERPARV